jgi:serine/threonine-protein kinase
MTTEPGKDPAMTNAMELDDLRQAWQALDRRMAEHNALRLDELRERKLSRVGRSLRPLAWGQVATMAFGIALVLLGVDTWTGHRDQTALFVSGLVVHAFGVLTIIAGGSTLAMINRIDYAAPVLAIQHQLLRLRRGYLAWGAIVGLPWWLLWLPVLVCLSKRNLLAAPGVLAGSLAIGVLGLLATWAFYRWTRGPGRERLARAMDDSAAGRSLVRAQASLDELRRFERD